MDDKRRERRPRDADRDRGRHREERTGAERGAERRRATRHEPDYDSRDKKEVSRNRSPDRGSRRREGGEDRKSRNRSRDKSGSRSKSRTRNDKSMRRNRSDSRDKREQSRSHKERSRGSSAASSVSSEAASALSGEEDGGKLELIAGRVAREEMSRLEGIEEERMRVKAEKKRQKEMQKLMETPEQKRIRRLAKKEAKERKRKKMMGWDEEYMGYTNADNPFGDANLHQTFVWDKKYEKLGVKEVDPEEIEKQNKIKLEENKRELEKVKQRRLEREREREERMEELNAAQRDKELAQFYEWEKQEDGFHLKQAKLRSKLRIREGRAKPIDLLARYFDVFGEKVEKPKNDKEKEEEAEDDNLSFELVEPYRCLNGLRVSDLEDLMEDIKVYMQLDAKGNMSYWQDLQIIVEDELGKLKNYGVNTAERREGINAAVSSDVTLIFKGKSPLQLAALENQIENKINSQEEGIDISYWETLLSKLKAHMARARLKEKHEDNLQKKLIKLKREQGVEGKILFPIKVDGASPTSTDTKAEVGEERAEKEAEKEGEGDDKLAATGKEDDPDAEQEPGPSKGGKDEAKEKEKEVERMVKEAVDLMERCKEAYVSGGYAPTLVPLSQVEPGTPILDPESEELKLELRRRQMIGAPTDVVRKKLLLSADEIAFEREAKKGMTDDEAIFSVEQVVTQNPSFFTWSDKYRPRKPRYFNRVHTGFEWNKYNQTHYDVDNPPPKIVQGYKFNIFYPDLIDKGKTPAYHITPCPENREFSIIKFAAGPPYEDIAFKIVNREWNYSYKSGFRCQFHNNILQLWFHFKRYRYRR